jgi:glycosyltransferase involved in cell wall biosynthesis
MPITVSVVMPFFRAQYFDEAIGSVRAQSYSPTEIIVVNDGAALQDAEHLRQYEGLRGIRILHQENRGVSAARNAGIAEATGDWLAFIDDDDEWEPDCLRLMTEYIEAHPDCRVLFHAVRVMGTDVVHHKGEVGLSDYLVAHPSPALPTCTMIHRKSFLRSGLFNPAVRMAEDYEAFLRLAMYNRFHYLDLPLTRRRKHDHNLSRRYDLLLHTRNAALFLYRDLYPNEEIRRSFARRLNSILAVAAFYRRDFRALPEILRYTHAQGASRMGMLFDAVKELWKNRG